MTNKNGRPRVIDFCCPKCGADALRCYRTKRQGTMTARYYVCASCGHHGVFIRGASRDWWKNTGNPDFCQ